MYQLRLLDAAVEDLARLDKPVARRIVKRLSWFIENFDLIQLVPLTGNLAGLYKLRVGDYRVIYEILYDEHLILVHFLGHRREVYR